MSGLAQNRDHRHYPVHPIQTGDSSRTTCCDFTQLSTSQIRLHDQVVREHSTVHILKYMIILCNISQSEHKACGMSIMGLIYASVRASTSTANSQNVAAGEIHKRNHFLPHRTIMDNSWIIHGVKSLLHTLMEGYYLILKSFKAV